MEFTIPQTYPSYIFLYMDFALSIHSAVDLEYYFYACAICIQYGFSEQLPDLQLIFI
jgi:hypothetical protein